MNPHRIRQGFSLIEALVVLAVGGLALAIIFGIGVKAGDTGFGLGRRALAAADSDIAASDLRAILRSLAVRPTALTLPGDRPLLGAADSLEGEVVLERATACAPQGWSGRLVLTVAGTGADRALICQGATQVRLLSLPRGEPAFSYSQDGAVWTSDFSSLAQVAASDGGIRSTRLWIRFAAPPVVDLVESAGSGRPEIWNRRVEEF